MDHQIPFVEKGKFHGRLFCSDQDLVETAVVARLRPVPTLVAVGWSFAANFASVCFSVSTRTVTSLSSSFDFSFYLAFLFGDTSLYSIATLLFSQF